MAPFKEIQRFNQWWLMAILFIPFFEALAFMLSDYQNKGEIQPDSIYFLISISFIVSIIFVCKLIVEINERGITYRFFPFNVKSKHLAWSEIEMVYIRTYKPLWEFGGWGIRRTLNNGKAYTIKGNIGLQLELKNGKRMLIGTSSAQKLEAYLLHIKSKHSIIAIR